MDEIMNIAARVGIFGVAITGGGLFAFSTFIMAALKRMPDPEGIRAMQQINKTVFTPWFIGPFFVTSAISVGAIVLAFMNTDRDWWIPLLCAGLLYAIGVFVVTAAGNVPLNEKLDRMDADDPETAEFWKRYLVVWTRWNHVRVTASMGSLYFLTECVHLLGQTS